MKNCLKLQIANFLMNNLMKIFLERRFYYFKDKSLIMKYFLFKFTKILREVNANFVNTVHTFNLLFKYQIN